MEFERSLEPILEEFMGYYQNVFGLPCAHIMQQMQCALSLDNIHSQWHLDSPVILPLLPFAQFVEARNTIISQGKRRPMGASNNSIHRDPAGFELVENTDTGLCCGHCVVRGMGHNFKTCPECTIIMVIQRPVLEESAMEGISNSDTLNNSCS